MADITIKLDDDACKEFVLFNGYQEEVDEINEDGENERVKNPKSPTDFMGEVLVARIQNDLTESRNRSAIEAANAQPVAEVTAE